MTDNLPIRKRESFHLVTNTPFDTLAKMVTDAGFVQGEPHNSAFASTFYNNGEIGVYLEKRNQDKPESYDRTMGGDINYLPAWQSRIIASPAITNSISATSTRVPKPSEKQITKHKQAIIDLSSIVASAGFRTHPYSWTQTTVGEKTTEEYKTLYRK